MARDLYVIYVPGLGDKHPIAQQLAVKLWTVWGVKTELLQMRWSDSESWSSKMLRLVERIDALHAEGKQVGLVGASAGASAVINAYAARKDIVVGCVLIAAKINHPETIGKKYCLENPAFVASAKQSEGSLALLDAQSRKRILSLYGFYDGIVSAEDSKIVGGDNRIRLSIGHSVVIASQIVFGAPLIVRFLRHASRSVST